MEKRSFLHLQGKERGELVAPNAFQRKLLPYEWGLIQALEITEQEYREIFQRIAEEQRKRPAEYAHIPDVTNEAISLTAVLVNIAVGLVLTGVSVLLAPKPSAAQEKDENKGSIVGSNQEGRTRFNNTVGFDGVPQLAQMGSRIPLVFGRFRTITSTDSEIETSGGIIVEPLLVWSQVLSKGTYQNFKGQYVVCDRGLDFDPSPQAFMMGGQPIDDIYAVNYEIFWSSRDGSNELTDADSLYGEAAPGDDKIFTVFNGGTRGKGFSSAFSPVNKSVFGVHSPIRNGGRWSLNWQVINLFQLDGRDDPGLRTQNRRRKICGTGGDQRSSGMKGGSRWYSPQMGIAAWRTDPGDRWSEPDNDDDLKTVNANLGDQFRFDISSRTFKFPEDLNAEVSYGGDNPVDEKGLNYDDINSALNSLRGSADDAMQRGEIFVVNQTLLQVVDRTGKFNPNLEGNNNKREGRVEVILKVIGFTGRNHTVGISHRNIFSSEGVMYSVEEDNINGAAESNHYSLCKCDIAQVANTRACQTTEIGIKSQVWTLLSGLCNFADVPMPNVLEDYDRDRQSVSAGSINKYTWRTSFFRLAVRVTNNDTYRRELVDGYAVFEEVLFAVRGKAPVDQFNYIRITPNGALPQKYEYRLIPVTGSHVYKHLEEGTLAYVLSADGQEYSRTYTPNIMADSFDITFKANVFGLSIGVFGHDPILDLQELYNAPGGYPGETVEKKRYLYSDPGPSTFKVGGGAYNDRYKYWWEQVTLETLFGNLKDENDPNNKAVYGEVRQNSVPMSFGGQNVRIRLEAVVEKNDGDHLTRYGTLKSWKLIRAFFEDTDEKEQRRDLGTRIIQRGMTYDKRCTFYRNMPAAGKNTNERRINHWVDTGEPIRQEYEIVVKQNSDEFRQWENNAQIKEISAYDEMTRSCDRGPEHEIMYVNESDAINSDYLGDFNYSNLTMFGFKVKSMNQTQQLQAIQVWLKDGMTIPDLSSGNRGPTDLLGNIVHFLLTDKGRGMRDIVPRDMVDKDSFIRTNKFLSTNRLYYNGALSDRVNLRAWIGKVAPFFLCHFSVRDGKFFMAPAIPVSAKGDIRLGPVPVSAYFNDGNIVDGSFRLNYLDASERRDFRCVVKYRESKRNTIPQYRTLQLQYNDLPISPDQEDYDLTEFCTTVEHAELAARYMLATRRRIDHTIEFSTSPFGIALAPGDWIKVETISSPLETRISGRIDGELRVIGNVSDGTHPATIYRKASDQVVNEDITVVDGHVTDETLRDSLFAIPLTQRRLGVYAVEELNLDEEGMVQVKASHHPVNSEGVSKINLDLTLRGDSDRFTLVE